MILFFLTEKHDLVIIKFNFRKWDITMYSIFNISSKSNINFTVSDGIKNVNFIHKKNPLPVARELIFCCEGRVRTSVRLRRI